MDKSAIQWAQVQARNSNGTQQEKEKKKVAIVATDRESSYPVELLTSSGATEQTRNQAGTDERKRQKME